mgnify:CR=1 FL=1
MLIVAVGVNHRTAPVEVREKLSFAEGSLEGNLSRLNSHPVVEGCVILSTCNRTEIYAATRKLDECLNAIWEFLAQKSGASISEIRNYTYVHTLQDAIRHLFRVAAGLDSMILGETQILGQVRRAYQLACRHRASNRVLNTLFQQAISVGKRVRTETGIDQNAVSISYAAVELAKSKFPELSRHKVLIIGAGKMSELAARYLVANGVSGVIVSNRSYQRAAELAAQLNGLAVRFDQLYRYMEEADIVISCTAATHYVVHYREMAEVVARRQGRELMIIDIAVPRDVDPAVGRLPGVTLYDIDDLQQVVDHNLAQRKKAAALAEGIIEEELQQFMQWLSMQFVVPTIIALKRWGEELKERELRRALNRLGPLSERERKIIGSLANSLVNQVLHVPITQLKSYALTPEGHLYMKVLQNLFRLELPGEKPAGEASRERAAER